MVAIARCTPHPGARFKRALSRRAGGRELGRRALPGACRQGLAQPSAPTRRTNVPGLCCGRPPAAQRALQPRCARKVPSCPQVPQGCHSFRRAKRAQHTWQGRHDVVPGAASPVPAAVTAARRRCLVASGGRAGTRRPAAPSPPNPNPNTTLTHSTHTPQTPTLHPPTPPTHPARQPPPARQAAAPPAAGVACPAWPSSSAVHLPVPTFPPLLCARSGSSCPRRRPSFWAAAAGPTARSADHLPVNVQGGGEPAGSAPAGCPDFSPAPLDLTPCGTLSQLLLLSAPPFFHFNPSSPAAPTTEPRSSTPPEPPGPQGCPPDGAPGSLTRAMSRAAASCAAARSQ